MPISLWGGGCIVPPPATGYHLPLSRQRRPYRLPREQYRGAKTVAFTLCCEDRVPLFKNEKVVRDLVAILQAEIPKHGCRCPIYCFMPDHIHLLINGLNEDADLLTPIERFKTRAGILLAMLKAPGKLQSSFYDHIVRNSDDWRSQAQYIALNPVRAGFVENPLEYPYTGVIGENRQEMLLSIFHG